MNINSREDVRKWLRVHGLTVSQWARERGFGVDTVYAVISGRAHGHWGEAHQVAVALGLKQEVVELSIPRPLDRISDPVLPVETAPGRSKISARHQPRRSK
ncbi:MAG: DNA-binding protein [Thiobacillus sp.]|nr:DNA-binding protein [Thiobacillus sp.]